MSIAEEAFWALWDYAGRDPWSVVRGFAPERTSTANRCEIAAFPDGSLLIRDEESGAWRTEEARAPAPRVAGSLRRERPPRTTDPRPTRR